MSVAELSLLLGVGFVAGILIGAVGVGGVIVVPLLVGLSGFTPSHAIAAAEFDFLVTGVIGMLLHARLGTLERSAAVPLVVAAVPAAALGALAAPRLPAAALGLGLAILMMVSGLAGLFRPRGRAAVAPGPAVHAACGLVTGFASALTGTGGPAVLLPILTALEARAVSTLALAQLVQLPIAGSATIVNVAQRSLLWAPSIALTAALAVGSWIGARLAVGLDAERLKAWICRALIVAGAIIALEQGLSLAHRVSGPANPSSTIRHSSIR